MAIGGSTELEEESAISLRARYFTVIAKLLSNLGMCQKRLRAIFFFGNEGLRSRHRHMWECLLDPYKDVSFRVGLVHSIRPQRLA
jgi:hypothetical protein